MGLKKILAKSMDKNVLRFLGYMKKEKWKMVFALLFMVLSGATSSMLASLLGNLTDIGFYQKESWVVYAAPLGLIGVAILHGGSMFGSGYLLAIVSQRTLATIRSEMFAKIMRWPASGYIQNSCGLLSTKFVMEANAMMTNAARYAIRLFRDIIQVIALVLTLIYHSWQLSLIILVLGPAIYWVLKKIAQLMKEVMASSQRSIAHLMVEAQEGYHAQNLIKLYNNYDGANKKFNQLNRIIKKLALKMIAIGSLGDPLTQVVAMIAVAGVMTVAMIQVQAGLMTLGGFITFLTALLLLVPPLRNIANMNTTLVMMSAATSSIFDTIDSVEEKDDGAIVLEKIKGNIEFKDVSLTYPERDTPAVQHFNLNVKAGEHIALVGASGSGKTTLINMIPRFWLPTEGQITVDGHDYTQIKLDSLRQGIAIVSQNVFLFNDTIRYNLTYGLGDVSEDRIAQALEMAALSDFVASLPEGLETVVGEAGSKLSGGQKQRLSIARALLKDAPILILDEATSALDSESEHHIQVAIEKLMVGRTCFTVAHRLSTIKNADRIVVMNAGVIKEIGTHTELMAKDGDYANLVKLQTLAKIEE